MGALVLGVASLASFACADSESMVFVRQVNSPVTSGTAGSCTVEANPDGPVITAGVLDIAFRSQYTAALVVGNQLTARGNRQQLRTETSGVHIEGAEVRLENSSGHVVWGPYTVASTGYVEPAVGIDPSYGLANAVLVGSNFVDRLRGSCEGASGDCDLTRTLRTPKHYTSVSTVFGRTLGGQSISSGEFRFPLSVCYGCLVAFPSDADDSKNSVLDCNLPIPSGTTLSTPCILGQEDPIDCRACKALGVGEVCNPAQ